jgi:hypothetical protein
VKTTYSVNGTSNTKPEGLPEGLDVVEETKTHDRLWAASRGGYSCKFDEFQGVTGESPWIRASFDNPVASFDMDTARKIGEWLIQVADSYKKELRKFSDGTSTKSHWYEVKPEWVVWAGSRSIAEDTYKGAVDVGNTDFGRNLSDVRGIYRDDFVQVPE